ncbi:MAG: hypothetical protein IJP29_06370 [Lachnospiraceae bacterium]|nr:hypothetical protein [Lachnospiraceae bacterium]
MKINCKNCGKRFDHEKHGGTCPKCGTVQTAGQYAPSELSNAYISMSASDTEQPNANLKQEAKASQTKTTPRKKTNPIVTVILLGAMVLTAVIPVLACHFVNQINADKQTMETFPETEVYTLNEPIPTDNTDITLTITEAIIDTNKKLVAPDGYEFLMISYHVEDKTNPEMTYVPYAISSGVKPYLITQDGFYLRPLASYSLRDALELNYEEARELGVSDYFDYPDGVLYFLVKENDTSALRLNYHHTDSSDYDAVQTLERIIEIENLEVRR